VHAYEFRKYVFSRYAHWYRLTIVLSVIVAALVFMVPENAYPIVYARYVLGSVLFFFLPGYSLTRVVFTANELDSIERSSLSIGISIVVVTFTGFLLNYTPLGIRIIPLTTSLLVETIVLATLAIIRECKLQIFGEE